MTDQELLESLDIFLDYASQMHLALSNLVKLHQAKSSEYFDVGVCEACSNDLVDYVKYPCKTIILLKEVLA